MLLKRPRLRLYNEGMNAVSFAPILKVRMLARKLAQMLVIAVVSFLPLKAFAEEGVGENVAGIANDWQTGFPAPASSVARQAFAFHDNLLMPVIAAICLFVFLLGGFICWRFAEKRNPKPSRTTHNIKLEVIWTLVPVAILAVLFVPSFNLMRTIEDVSEADLTVKATGHQWYWSYEYRRPRRTDLRFKAEKAISTTNPNDCCKPMLSFLPVGQKVRSSPPPMLSLLVCAKLRRQDDGVPGPPNETWFTADEKGVYYGFCMSSAEQDRLYARRSACRLQSRFHMAQKSPLRRESRSSPKKCRKK